MNHPQNNFWVWKGVGLEMIYLICAATSKWFSACRVHSRGEVGWPPKIILCFFLLIILRWFYLFFQSSKTYLKPPRHNFQNYFEVREVFLSNSGTLPNILFATFQKLFWGGWVVSKEIILRWVRVFLKKYFAVGCVLEAPQIIPKNYFGGWP